MRFVVLAALNVMGMLAVGRRGHPLLAPAPGSPLLAAGVHVGLPFTGAAPDLGGKQQSQQ